MCGVTEAGLALAAVTAVSSYTTSRSNARVASYNAQQAMNVQFAQNYRDAEYSNLMRGFQDQQFGLDMSGKMMQMSMAQAEFSQQSRFKMEQLALQLQQHESALESQHLQNMSKIDWAGKTMEAAHDAAKTDLELLSEQWEQINSGITVDMFERKRQAMKEAATIRVSQGESGIFGNTALKEVANSIMQEGFDNSIMQYNLKNQGKQKGAEARAILATETSRTNEALSTVVNRFLTGSAMNPAVASIQI